MTFQVSCSGTKVNKAITDIPICISDSTFYQTSLSFSPKDPAQICGHEVKGLYWVFCSYLNAWWSHTQDWMDYGSQENLADSASHKLKETQCNLLCPVWLKLGFSFVIEVMFLLFPHVFVAVPHWQSWLISP